LKEVQDEVGVLTGGALLSRDKPEDRKIVEPRAYNSDHQALIADRAWDVCRENNVRLIVVDSLTSHFRGEYVGREALALTRASFEREQSDHRA
jgi:DNA repair protein RadA